MVKGLRGRTKRGPYPDQVGAVADGLAGLIQGISGGVVFAAAGIPPFCWTASIIAVSMLGIRCAIPLLHHSPSASIRHQKTFIGDAP